MADQPEVKRPASAPFSRPGGSLLPTLNVLIEDCDLFRGHGAVAFGSGATGGVANVVARHLRLHDPRLQFGLRIKLNRASGGAVQHVWFRDVGSVGLTFRSHRSEGGVEVGYW